MAACDGLLLIAISVVASLAHELCPMFSVQVWAKLHLFQNLKMVGKGLVVVDSVTQTDQRWVVLAPYHL